MEQVDKMEINTVWNQISVGSRTTVTTVVANLSTLVTAISGVQGAMKSQIVTNMNSSNAIFFSKAANATAENAEGYLGPLETKTFHFIDKSQLPYFIAAADSEMGVIVIQ